MMTREAPPEVIAANAGKFPARGNPHLANARGRLCRTIQSRGPKLRHEFCALGARQRNTHRPTTASSLAPRATFRIVMVLGRMLSNTGPTAQMTASHLAHIAAGMCSGARHMQLQPDAPKWG